MHGPDWYDEFDPYPSDSDSDDSDSDVDLDINSDREDNSTITDITPEQKMVLSNLRETVKTSTESIDIDRYLRSLINSMIVVSPSTDSVDQIIRLIRNEIDEHENELAHPYYVSLVSLMNDFRVRRETLDLQGRTISWKEERTHSLISRSVETGRWGTYLDGTVYTSIQRHQYDALRGFKSQMICLNSVDVEELEDRYIERYPRWENDEIAEMEMRTVWKRDLWRDELHTQPFKTIHQELLYSPDLPLWYYNQCREAEKHFEVLLKR